MTGGPELRTSAAGSGPPARHGRTWFGHPRGLATLFFTEMWERFSYYGMRALLVLFMTASLTAANPGLGFDDRRAGALYGLYTSMVYLLSLPGGWLADRIWGQRRAVFVGGCIIALGHFTLAAPLLGFPEVGTFYLGLLFIVLGSGLLKPNVSTMVGALYPHPETGATHEEREELGARRDAAFSIFYMGINLGAILGPFVCGTLGERINWHWGFSAAGFGMLLGLFQYVRGDRYLGAVGRPDPDEPREALARRSRTFWLVTGSVAALAALFTWLASSGVISLGLDTFVTWLGYGILLVTIVFFAYRIFRWEAAAGFFLLFVVLSVLLSLRSPGPTEAGQWAIVATLAVFMASAVGLRIVKGAELPVTEQRLMVIFWLFLLAAVFWSGFEQAGSSMNLFAERLTDRTFFGWEMPTSWLQNVNPIFIVILAPVFGWLWQWLARRDRNPSIPMKFALGLLGLSAGFFVLSWGGSYATNGARVSVAWLVVTYFLHTCGELSLSPVGLSSMTKLAPRGQVGQMMGVWFIASALGNLFAGLVAGSLETMSSAVLFRSVALFVGAVGVVAVVVSPAVRKLMGQIE